MTLSDEEIRQWAALWIKQDDERIQREQEITWQMLRELEKGIDELNAFIDKHSVKPVQQRLFEDEDEGEDETNGKARAS